MNSNQKTQGNSKTLSRLFSSGVQALAIQVLGTLFFYFLSLKLPKTDFGAISWANACSALMVTVLSLGLEQIIARRMAANNADRTWPAAAFLIHALASAILGFIFLWTYNLLVSNSESKLLLLFFGVQSFIFIISPLRQYLNAQERFTPYAFIALISNSGKIIGAIALNRMGLLTVKNIALLLIGTGAFEWLALLLYSVIKGGFTFHFGISKYKRLVHEAIPQYVSVLFDIGLARADWILLGWLSSKAATADYSFAYRGFEMGKLPLIAIASLLLPRFARIMAEGLNTEKRVKLHQTFNAEVLLASILLLLACVLWQPLISLITSGKYGDSDAPAFWILAFCLPVHFAINFFWTICFCAQQYKKVSVITVITATTNIILNLLLIPRWGGTGAAAAFFISSTFQLLLYYRLTVALAGAFPWRAASVYFLSAGIAFGIIHFAWHPKLWMELPGTLLIFTGLVLISGHRKSVRLSYIKTLIRS